MGGFFDADGTLARAAVLDKATRKLREVDSGASGWQFRKGDTRWLMKFVAGVEPEEESDGDPAKPRKGRKTFNRQAD